MKRLLLLGALSALALLVFASAAFAQTDRDCPGFPSQAAAQSYFEAGGGSASNNFNNLDANHNGVACENYMYSGGGSSVMMTQPTKMGTTAPMTTAPMTTAPMTTPVTTAAPMTTAPITTATASTTSALPNTGGPATLLLPAAALLVGGGLLAFGIRRR